MSTDEEPSPEAYRSLVDQVLHEATVDFRQATDEKEKKLACCRYFKRGAIVGLSHPELIDFLGISTPSILEVAGFSEEEVQEVMDSLSSISDEEIENATI
jgi:hypothetical protein